MKRILLKLVVLSPLVVFLSIAPFQNGICDDCSKKGEPCSIDGVIGSCCKTDTDPATNRTFPLTCKEDADTMTGFCVEQEEEDK